MARHMTLHRVSSYLVEHVLEDVVFRSSPPVGENSGLWPVVLGLTAVLLVHLRHLGARQPSQDSALIGQVLQEFLSYTGPALVLLRRRSIVHFEQYLLASLI